MSTVLKALSEALGPVINAALEDPATQDVVAQANGTILRRKHGKWDSVGRIDENRRLAVLTFAAHLAGRCIRPDRPTVSAILPTSNARLKGQIPPAAPGAQFFIRRPAPRLFDLQSYLDGGIMTEAQVGFVSANAGKRTLLIGGPIGSGKSTLMNTVINLPAYRRKHAVYIQDDDELRPPPLAEKLFTAEDTDPPVTLQSALQDALRMMAEVIGVGEVRGKEALDLIMAWNTGVKGVSTIHADSAVDAIERLDQLVALNGGRVMSRGEICRSVNSIAFIKEQDDGSRRVEEIVSVERDRDGGWTFRQVA